MFLPFSSADYGEHQGSPYEERPAGSLGAVHNAGADVYPASSSWNVPIPRAQPGQLRDPLIVRLASLAHPARMRSRPGYFSHRRFDHIPMRFSRKGRGHASAADSLGNRVRPHLDQFRCLQWNCASTAETISIRGASEDMAVSSGQNSDHSGEAIPGGSSVSAWFGWRGTMLMFDHPGAGSWQLAARGSVCDPGAAQRRKGGGRGHSRWWETRGRNAPLPLHRTSYIDSGTVRPFHEIPFLSGPGADRGVHTELRAGLVCIDMGSVSIGENASSR